MSGTISRRNFLTTAGVAVAATATGLVQSNFAFGQGAPIVLKYASSLPDSHPLNAHMRDASVAIKKETNGRVDLQIYANAQMGGDTDMLSQVRAGGVDFIPLPGAILSTLIPVASIESVPFAFKNYDAVWAAMDGELGTHVRAEVAKTGLIAMDKVWNNGFRQITSSTRPIKTPADLKGFKIRVLVSPLWTSMFKAFGAAPTGISINETYSALQTKVVEGQENPLVVVQSTRLYEVQKYCSLTGHIWNGFWLLASGKTWPKLPKDVQEIIAKNINAAAMKQREEVIALNHSLEPTLSAKGITFNTVDRQLFRSELQKKGFYAEWRKKYGDAAWALLEKYSGQLS
ncbi:TRAP transporter substrate-binding protein [Pandoraea terrigena]|uniref:Sialic acid-binding periplasmic protein SiaP n=1 Tax=Pandoraea terrigena TaxID=2508292 RepID=A0A5E4Y2P0_9BURK|nr:TRAP transporter substrate-binding protein [Pandoraea terrigena]VVE42582.1 Sialic acid-binding periplasmic protein SiaP [Pandoraea terrigena]